MGRGEVAPSQFIALGDILVDPENPCQIGDGDYPHWIDALGTIPIEQWSRYHIVEFPCMSFRETRSVRRATTGPALIAVSLAIAISIRIRELI